MHEDYNFGNVLLCMETPIIMIESIDRNILNKNHYFHPIRFGDVILDYKLLVCALLILLYHVPRESVSIQIDVSNWVTDNCLRVNGLYNEGFVDDLESLLDYHKIATVTTYGTRSSLVRVITLKEKKTNHLISKNASRRR